MRVIIVGYGTVGKAQEFLLKKLGHEVFVFDPYGFADQKRPENLLVSHLFSMIKGII